MQEINEGLPGWIAGMRLPAVRRFQRILSVAASETDCIFKLREKVTTFKTDESIEQHAKKIHNILLLQKK